MPIIDTPSFQLFMKKGLPIVLYRLPGDDKPSLIAQTNKSLEEIDLELIDNHKGFVVSGFSQSMEGKAFVIRPDIFFSSDLIPDGLLKEVESLPDAIQTSLGTTFTDTKKNYLEKLSTTINELKSGDLSKVVSSRVLRHETGMIDSVKLFSRLGEKYPDAFVYLLHLPDIGVWVGATPETLLHIDDHFIKTVALAGTQRFNQVNWTEKEVEEQELVSTYIEKALEKEQVSNFERKGPYTIQAGNLAHLKTTFKIPVNRLKGRLGSLIHHLHPTPAVCGLPKIKAFYFIQEIESHDRALYTGFLGPWKMAGKSDLFVNLRCAQLEETAVRIFVGGGITAKSNAEAEWEETVNKSETLLSVLKNL